MKTIFQKHNALFFPLIPEPYLSAKKVFLDLSQSSPSPFSHPINKPNQLNLGKYGEDRGIYTQEIFKNNKLNKNRTLHLGLDIELPAGTPIFLPFAGKIIGSKNNAHSGDYGPTLIIQHELENQIFYSLYGHLSTETLARSPKKKNLHTGVCFAHSGTSEENGGWPPHIHVQLILKLDKSYITQENYPGVCSRLEAEKFLENSPDPSDFIGIFNKF